MCKKISIGLFLSGFLFSLNANAVLLDPTQPTQPSSSLKGKSSEGGLQLNAIFYSTSKPVAIIGGDVLRIDDTIENYKVTEIQRNAVVLTSSKGEKLILKIELPDIKKPHI